MAAKLINKPKTNPSKETLKTEKKVASWRILTKEDLVRRVGTIHASKI